MALVADLRLFLAYFDLRYLRDALARFRAGGNTLSWSADGPREGASGGLGIS